MEDFYKVLGVPRTATESELKSAYRKLAKRYHPDTHPGDKECEERFRQINEAYDTLSNPTKRSKYDREYKTDNRRKTESGKSEETRKRNPNVSPEMDFANIHKTFEQFFGFNPDSHDVVNEDKLNPNKKGNPLDTTAFFEKFMGVKK